MKLMLCLINQKIRRLKMKNRIFILFVLITTGLTLTLLNAQSKKTIEEKLKQLKGEIEKIVISTDEGEVTFEGEEAKEIEKRLSNFYGEKDWKFEIKGEGDKERVFVIKKGDSSIDNFNWITAKGDSISSMITLDEIEGPAQTIQIEMEEGSKKITVTKIDENGDETTETYEGEEADEYLETLEDENDISILQLDHLGGEKESVRVIIEKLKKK